MLALVEVKEELSLGEETGGSLMSAMTTSLTLADFLVTD
jgi:hypothetical protein